MLSCYVCETHGGQGLSCDQPIKQQCPPQTSASCLKAKASQKGPSGKWVPIELKNCDSGKSTDPANPLEVCEDQVTEENRGRRCRCFTDNCNDGSLPEVRSSVNQTDSSSAFPLFTGSTVTFSLGGALLVACYRHLI